MIKALIASVMLLLLGTAVTGQTLSADSLTQLVNADVKSFKLNKADFKIFRKDRSKKYSDWFKPVKGNVSDTALLADSAYVKAFRNAAYYKTLKRRTTGHYFLVGRLIYAAVM